MDVYPRRLTVWANVLGFGTFSLVLLIAAPPRSPRD
jgi:hypothetical protein